MATATSGFLTGVGELLLAGLLAEIMSVLGAIASIASAIIALPGAWIAQDKVARFNGHCRGYWDAFQDMANGFKDSSLDTKPYDQWPAIPKPMPHYDMSVKEEDLPAAARAEREGWRRGCNEAYEKMTDLESNPKDYTVKKKNKTYKVTGKLLLRALYKWKGSDAGEEVKKAINKKLRESGKPEWPVH
jgi:hypothetical protein